jgi:hypothetical protein
MKEFQSSIHLEFEAKDLSFLKYYSSQLMSFLLYWFLVGLVVVVIVDGWFNNGSCLSG